MSYDSARPLYSLPLAGKTYDLVGTFGLIEAVEHALQEGILKITARIIDMSVTETTTLLAAILNASGEKTTPKEMGELLFNEIGIDSEGHATLKIHLYAFLRTILAPPKDREETAKTMGELIGRLGEATVSRGGTTSASA